MPTLSKEHTLPFDKRTYHQRVFRLTAPTLKRFRRILLSHVLFDLFFWLLLGSEIVGFVAFFSLFSTSHLLAFSLALIFLTLFSYFVLRLYLQAKKPDQIADVLDEFLERSRELLRYQEGIPEHHSALAGAASKFAGELLDAEYRFYAPPSFLKGLSAMLEKFGAWCHFKDFHRLRELLLMTTVEEHLKVVKCEPTNLEVHANLANTYVMLSSLYADPTKKEGADEERWFPKERMSETMHSNFMATANQAIEEFKILNHYAPDDPWVHMQLAYSYRDLHMPEEEIAEYETILRLRPDDKDTHFKLGMLYFQQGHNAQGLRIYELLKRLNYQRAEKLIKFYGSFEPF